MKFSLGIFPYERFEGIGPLAEVVQRAEELGFFGVQFPEHIVLPAREGAPSVTWVWYDNCILVAHLATLTSRLRFIFNVMVVPYRPPILAAKLLATLDVVSQGRLILGVGSGWLKDEFRSLGVPLGERGAIMDEYLRAMKTLWTQEPATFEGKHVSFSNVSFLPKPLQKPHIPIWFGGSGPRPLRRLVELEGDGWCPMKGTLEELARDTRWIREQVRERGRDPDSMDFSFLLSVGKVDPVTAKAVEHAGASEAIQAPPATAPQAIEAIRRYQAAGCTHMGIGFSWEDAKDLVRQMEWFAAEVMPAFR